MHFKILLSIGPFMELHNLIWRLLASWNSARRSAPDANILTDEDSVFAIELRPNDISVFNIGDAILIRCRIRMISAILQRLRKHQNAGLLTNLVKSHPVLGE